MTYPSDITETDCEAERVVRLFEEYVKTAGRLIDARLQRYDENRAGLLLCCAALVCGSDDKGGAYADVDKKLSGHFKEPIFPLLHQIVYDIQKVEHDFLDTMSPEDPPGVETFIRAHGFGDVSNGLQAICTVLSQYV